MLNDILDADLLMEVSIWGGGGGGKNFFLQNRPCRSVPGRTKFAQRDSSTHLIGSRQIARQHPLIFGHWCCVSLRILIIFQADLYQTMRVAVRLIYNS